MRLSDRQSNFLKALHAAFGANAVITVALIHRRIAGLALKEQTNVGLLMALQGCVGRKLDSRRTGLLLQKIEGKRLGDLELTQDGEMKRANRREYFLVDHANPTPMPPLPKPKRFNSLETLGAWEKDQAEIDANNAKLEEETRRKMDRQLQHDIAQCLGRQQFKWIDKDGQLRQEPVEQPTASVYMRERDRMTDDGQRAPGAIVYDPRTGLPMKEKPVVRAAPEPAAAPSVPKSKGDVRPVWMREGRNPTRAEWDEWQGRRRATHCQHSGPGDGSGRGSIDWFIKACNARNGF